MSLADKLAAAGFKPEANSEGEWQPYNGTYRCSLSALRAERDEKNNCDFVQTEYEIQEVLTGDMKRESKYPAFRKRYYLDFENPTEDHLDNAKELANVVFTATGAELDFSSKSAFIASASPLVGQDAYLRAWGFKFEKDFKGNAIPADQQKSTQFFKVMKKSAAEKKRTADSVAF